MVRQVTIWHNNIGRPIELGYGLGTYEGRSGISPFAVGNEASDADFAERFARDVERYGAVIVENNDRPYDSRGVWDDRPQHDDADWAESRFTGSASMAAYYENDDAYGGRRIGGRKGTLIEEEAA